MSAKFLLDILGKAYYTIFYKLTSTRFRRVLAYRLRKAGCACIYAHMVYNVRENKKERDWRDEDAE